MSGSQFGNGYRRSVKNNPSDHIRIRHLPVSVGFPNARCLATEARMKRHEVKERDGVESQQQESSTAECCQIQNNLGMGQERVGHVLASAASLLGRFIRV